MAINFAEVFLRESGAAQDRASNMVQLQLQANKFAADQAIAQANALANKANAESLAALRAFQIETGRTKAEQDTQLFENQQELFDINQQISNNALKESNLNLNTRQKEEEYLNSPISQEEAENYNLPLTTTNREFNAFLIDKVKRLDAKKQELEVATLQGIVDQQAEQKEIAQNITQSVFDEGNQIIAEEDAFEFGTDEERLSRAQRFSRNFASSLLGMLFPAPNILAQRARLEREADIGLTQEGQERIIGQRPVDVLGGNPELIKNIIKANIEGAQFQNAFNLSSILGPSLGVEGTESFLRRVSLQENPPPVEE